MIERLFEVLYRSTGHAGKVSMKHVFAKNHKQARSKANGHGHIISIRKVDPQKLYGNIEKLDLHETIPNPLYPDAVAMSELLVHKKRP